MTPRGPVGYPEVLDRLGELIIARKQHPLTRYKAPLSVPIDEHWWAWMNGAKEPRKIEDAPAQSMAYGMEVPPFTAAVFFNGWLAGLVDPGGGTLCAGAVANENALCAAMRAATEKAVTP